MGEQRVAIVGYGEVGRIFGAGIAAAGTGVSAYDILITDDRWAQPARERAARDDIALHDDLRSAVAEANLVICAVTAASAATAAREIAAACTRGALVLDVNSASPRCKGEGAKGVNAAGGRYVEAAVMTSVPPYGMRVPMLLGGPHAAHALPTLERLGFAATLGSPEYGIVSAVKLCRSVMIKGMEALAIESLLAARRYGVEREVLASLAETFPGLDWERQASYFWQRVVQHGKRRAEEMREAAMTVDDAGFEGRMATATADVQQWIATLAASGAFTSTRTDAGWRELADAVPAGQAKPNKSNALS